MDNNFFQQLKAERASVKEQINKFNKRLAAIDVLLEDYSEDIISGTTAISPYLIRATITPKKAGRPKKNLFDVEGFPTVYSSNLSNMQKTYIAVHQLGSAYSIDVANKLHELDPKEFPADKALRVAREECYQLNKNGLFDVEAFGKKFKYSIKEKANEVREFE